MDKEELKKEIGELEIEAQTARNKNLDARKDTSNIHKEKVSLIETIALLKKEKEELSLIVAKLKNRIKEADDKIKQDKLSIAKYRAMVDQSAAHNRNEAKENEETRIKLEKREGTLKADNLQLKDGRRKVSEREAGAQRKLDDVKKAKKLYEVGIAANDKDKEGHKKRGEAIEKNENEATANLEEARKLKAIYEGKIEETNVEKRKAKEAMQHAKNIEEATNKRGDELNRGEISLILDKEKVNQRNKNLETAYGVLKEREDEFEVKRLRLEKSEKNGTVKAELKKLREEIEKDKEKDNK